MGEKGTKRVAGIKDLLVVDGQWRFSSATGEQMLIFYTIAPIGSNYMCSRLTNCEDLILKVYKEYAIHLAKILFTPQCSVGHLTKYMVSRKLGYSWNS